MLVARVYGDARRFQSTAKLLLADLHADRDVEPAVQLAR
jgi:hypothetical protein